MLVEYDADHGNHWVPYPISFAAWQRLAPAAGFAPPRLLGRVPSRFLGAIYAARLAGPGLTGRPGPAWYTPALTAMTERSRSEHDPQASAGRCEPRGDDGHEGRSRAVRLAPDTAPREPRTIRPR